MGRVSGQYEVGSVPIVTGFGLMARGRRKKTFNVYRK
jgi:hypothetical protein